MTQKKVAIVQPFLVPGGGTEAVTAWTIEALKNDYQPTLITFTSVDADTLNRFYGTHLREDEVTVIQPSLPPLLNRTNRFAMLKDHLIMRYCKSIRTDFDLFISIGGGMDFGHPAVQYFAFAPASTLVKVLSRDPGVPNWYHILKIGFMRLCQRISGFSQESMNRNISLATSQWTGKIIEDIYGIRDYEVVFPPVSAPRNDVPWETRENGFLCIARIVPEKMIEHAIEALKQVREKGFTPTLRIIGRRDDPNYFRRIRQLCRDNSSWVHLDGVLPKDDLFHLMSQYRYGINAAPGEPSGVAALEMVKAGCIVFVAGGGGLPEILDIPDLTFDGTDDAAEKVTAVLSNETLQHQLLSQLGHSGESFSTDAFCRNMQQAVERAFQSASGCHTLPHGHR